VRGRWWLSLESIQPPAQASSEDRPRKRATHTREYTSNTHYPQECTTHTKHDTRHKRMLTHSLTYSLTHSRTLRDSTRHTRHCTHRHTNSLPPSIHTHLATGQHELRVDCRVRSRLGGTADPPLGGGQRGRVNDELLASWVVPGRRDQPHTRAIRWSPRQTPHGLNHVDSLTN
jgi:hypothetical protein